MRSDIRQSVEKYKGGSLLDSINLHHKKRSPHIEFLDLQGMGGAGGGLPFLNLQHKYKSKRGKIRVHFFSKLL